MVVDIVDYLEDMLWWQEDLADADLEDVLEDALEDALKQIEIVIMLKDILDYTKNIWESIIDIEIIEIDEHMQEEY